LAGIGSARHDRSAKQNADQPAVGEWPNVCRIHLSIAEPVPAAGSHIRRAVAPRKQPQFHIINRLTLIGFICADAEAKTGNGGSQFTVFSVATKRLWKNAQGDWESRTEWHRCLAFGKLGEFATSLKKGAHVQVEDELRGREYEKDGVTHRVFECCVESILKLDRAVRQEPPDTAEDLDS
jgi:single-strand DNA-binding protein